MAEILKITDIYTGATDPEATINPTKVGAFYINNRTGESWTCIDNTKDKNVWELSLIQDRLKDLGTHTGSSTSSPFNFNFNSYPNFNNFKIVLTGDTYFGTITGSGAKERSGYFRITSGGTYLKQMFTNASYSFTVPFNYSASNTNNGSEVFLFYKLFPDGKVLFTKG